MNKIVLIIGARPNFMKAFPVYEALKDDFDLTLIHTGQHFDAKMSDVFFNQLKFPRPDIHLSLESKSKSGDFDDKLYVQNNEYLKNKDRVIHELMSYDGDLGQLGEIRDKLKIEFEKGRPDLVIVFGDVTSTLSAGLAAKELGIDIAHVESGLRSGDLLMPEEVNRVLTDHITKYYFVTEQSGIDNFTSFGITENVYLVGNTMIDTQKKYLQQALETKYQEKLGVNSNEYVLITLHRPSNVDDLDKLKEIFDDLEELSKTETLVYPIHPRTKNNLEKLGYLRKVQENPNIILDEPLGYLEFTCLMANCKYLVTDSGGLQEESTSLDIPCFTLRENTERPSTFIENHGTNQLIHKISEIELKECKGSMDLWDGKSSERINIIIMNMKLKSLIYHDNRENYRKKSYAWNKFTTIEFLKNKIYNFKSSVIKTVNVFDDIPKDLHNMVLKNFYGCCGKSVYVLRKINDNIYEDILHKKTINKEDITDILESDKGNFFIEKNITDDSNKIPYDIKFHICNGNVLFAFIYDRNNKNTKCLLDANGKLISCDSFYLDKNWSKENGFAENNELINTIDTDMFIEIRNNALDVYNKLELDYCSIDYLYYKNKYSFCELTPTPGAFILNIQYKYCKMFF